MQQSLSLKRPSVFIAFALTLSLISVIFVASSLTATAQTALTQCNGTDNVGGQAVECHYTVTNNLNGSVLSSTVTVVECHGAANAPATLVCNPSTTTSAALVTVIDQCNGSGNGGGGTVLCTVEVINNITGIATPTSATVNQCNASGTGGGTEPTVLCDPFPANTTSATVTQCNESGNGGGGTQRVQCTVDAGSTTTAVLDVTINQCNGSGNGGGATVTCRTGITNNVTAAPGPSPTPTPGASPTPGGTSTPGPVPTPGPSPTDDAVPNSPAPSGPITNPSAPDSAGGAGTDSGTTSQVVRVPVGGAAAGAGSTSGVEHVRLLLLGFFLLACAIPAVVIRERVKA